MLNTFQKIFKLAFIFSALVTGWTSIVLLSNTSFEVEIKQLITKMYLNQKNFMSNVKDLSLLLVKDANERFSDDNRRINQLNNSKLD